MGTIVVMGPPGRLGNRLHLYASVIAFALRRGHRVVNFGFLRYAHYFTGTSGDVLTCAYPSGKPAGSRPGPLGRLLRLLSRAATRITIPLLRLVPDSLVVNLGQDASEIERNQAHLESEIASREVVVIRGFSFRDMEAIAAYAPAIREHFRPVEPHASAVAARARALRRGPVLVGVHVRKSDYRKFKGGRFDFTVDQYAGLVRCVADLFADPGAVSFTLVSDDPEAARSVAHACPGHEIGFGTGHPVEDLYLLAACDYLLGPPSTFSKWASFYGEKPLYVVADPEAPLTLDDFEVYVDLRPWLT